MASVQIKTGYQGKTGQEIYEAALKAIPNAGLQVWKKRELAQLVLGVGQHEGEEVRCNIVVSMVDGSVTISAEGDNLGEEGLNQVAARLTEELDKILI